VIGMVVGAEHQRGVSHLFRLRHAANRLRLRKFFKHFRFPAGVVFCNKSVDKRRMHPPGQKRVTPNVFVEKILRHRVSHR
jgi:hypothetical protein